MNKSLLILIVTSEILLLFIVIKLYIKYNLANLRFETCKRELELYKKSEKTYEAKELSYKKLIFILREAIINRPTAVAGGYIKRAYEVHSDGKIINKAKIMVEGNPTKRISLDCKLYYKITSKSDSHYINENDFIMATMNEPNKAIEAISNKAMVIKTYAARNK